MHAVLKIAGEDAWSGWNAFCYKFYSIYDKIYLSHSISDISLYPLLIRNVSMRVDSDTSPSSRTERGI